MWGFAAQLPYLPGKSQSVISQILDISHITSHLECSPFKVEICVNLNPFIINIILKEFNKLRFIFRAKYHFTPDARLRDFV